MDQVDREAVSIARCLGDDALSREQEELRFEHQVLVPQYLRNKPLNEKYKGVISATTSSLEILCATHKEFPRTKLLRL